MTSRTRQPGHRVAAIPRVALLVAGIVGVVAVPGLAAPAPVGVAGLGLSQNLGPDRLRDAIVAMMRTSSVSGREQQAIAHVRALLSGLAVEQDRLGNLVVELGSGSPRRLMAVPLDEPGYVISGMQEDGFLRITPTGRGYRGALAHQYLEGNEVAVVTATGTVPGAIGVPSAHLTGFARTRSSEWPPFAWQDAYVDVGAGSAREARDLGIRPMDTLTLIKRPVTLNGDQVAAPSAQAKAAAVALAEVAHRLAQGSLNGTVVLAWTTLELLNGLGLESVVRRAGPFDEAFVVSRDFGWQGGARTPRPASTPPPGSGVLAAAPLNRTLQAPHLGGPPSASPDSVWGDTEVHFLGLPTRYQDTPVESISVADVAALSDLLVDAAGADTPPASLPRVSSPARSTRDDPSFPGLAETLGRLVGRYGVSGSEGPVRTEVEALLPEWAETVVDAAGNLHFTVGQGDDHIVFVAHMDETGYRVTEVRADGRLELRARGGMLQWIWEGQAALVHTGGGDVPAIFEPRADHFDAGVRSSATPLVAYVGANDPATVESLGIRVGDSLTMPKTLRRIGRYRGMARALDDRAGSAALVEAVRRIDPAALAQRVTFAWSVGEEIGLLGAWALAPGLDDATTVYPVDTFVSSDAPLESRATAYAPLGDGFVIRVVESVNFAPAALVSRLQDLAHRHGIDTQLGMTSGGTDGRPWVAQGTPSLPISWPGRYSHSPIEVLDFRDLDALVRMIVVLAQTPAGSHD